MADVDLKTIKAAIDQNASVLCSIVQTLQDVQRQGVNTDRRLESLEKNVQTLMAQSSQGPDLSGEETRKDDGTKQQFDHLQKEIQKVDGRVINKMDALKDSIDSVKDGVNDRLQNISQNLTTQNDELKTLEYLKRKLEENATATEKRDNSISDLNNRVKRLTNVSVFSNTKLRLKVDGLSMAMKKNSSQLKRQIKGKTDELMSTMEYRFETISEWRDEMDDQLARRTQTLATTLEDGITKLADKADHIDTRLETLKDTSDNQLAKLTDVYKGFEVGGKFFKLFFHQTYSVLDQIITESQITREVVQNSRTVRKNYTCDFHVTNFSQWVGSGDRQFSRIWYIDAAGTHFKGRACFTLFGSMNICLSLGRIPRVTGLAATRRKDFQFKCLIMKAAGGSHWEVASGVFRASEDHVPVVREGWLKTLGTPILVNVDCAELTNKGFVVDDKIVIRFEIY